MKPYIRQNIAMMNNAMANIAMVNIYIFIIAKIVANVIRVVFQHISYKWSQDKNSAV